MHDQPHLLTRFDALQLTPKFDRQVEPTPENTNPICMSYEEGIYTDQILHPFRMILESEKNLKKSGRGRNSYREYNQYP